MAETRFSRTATSKVVTRVKATSTPRRFSALFGVLATCSGPIRLASTLATQPSKIASRTGTPAGRIGIRTAHAPTWVPTEGRGTGNGCASGSRESQHQWVRSTHVVDEARGGCLSAFLSCPGRMRHSSIVQWSSNVNRSSSSAPNFERGASTPRGWIGFDRDGGPAVWIARTMRAAHSP